MKKIYRPNAPCKDCPDRVLGCHAICEKYIIFKEKLNEYNQQQRYESINNDCFARKPVDSHGHKIGTNTRNSMVAMVCRKKYYEND